MKRTLPLVLLTLVIFGCSKEREPENTPATPGKSTQAPELPGDLPDADRIATTRALRQSLNFVCRVPRSAGRLDTGMPITLRNPLATPASVLVEWRIPERSGWTIVPARGELRLGPSESRTVDFRLEWSGEDLYSDNPPMPGYRVLLTVDHAADAPSTEDTERDALCDIRGQLALDFWPWAEARDRMFKSVLDPEPIRVEIPLKTRIEYHVANSLDTAAFCGVHWDCENEHWKIEPEHKSEQIEPGGSGVIAFDVTFNGKPEEIFPLPLRYLWCSGSNKETILVDHRPLPVDVKGIFKGTRREELAKYCDIPFRMDGVLGADWCIADPGNSDFILNDGSGEPRCQTRVWLMTGDKGLWIAFRCKEPRAWDVRAEKTDHDDDVRRDDSCEIFIDTNLDRKTCYHFIFNTLGTRQELREDDAAWDGDWQVKTAWEQPGTRSGAWTAEIFIPWKTLGSRPKHGEKWGVNFVRNRTVGGGECSAWSPMLGPDHLPERFGIMEAWYPPRKR